MRTWTKLIIDVDYSPSDPGIRNCFCESTPYEREQLSEGMPLRYDDPGGLFSSITLVKAGEESVTLRYKDSEYVLTPEKPYKKLDTGGRNYTNFDLSVYLKVIPVIASCPEFFRELYAKYSVVKLPEAYLEAFRSSDAPEAKYALGRWHLCLAPEGEESIRKAEALLREAASAGVADAYDQLCAMVLLGDIPCQGDVEAQAAALRDKALALGSGLASLRYARNRIAGIMGAPEEPDKVAQEIETLLAQDPDATPEWYSVLGYAYETLGSPKAREAYEKGIEKGCVRCHAELAFWLREDGQEEAYHAAMEAGMSAGNGLCHILNYDYPEEKFDALPPDRKRHFTRWVMEKLERGAALGEGLCAYYLASNYFTGMYGFPEDIDKAVDWLQRGVVLSDAPCCRLLASMLEADNPSAEDLEEAARLRKKAHCIDPEEDQPEEEDPEEDDGRWDAYV